MLPAARHHRTVKIHRDIFYLQVIDQPFLQRHKNFGVALPTKLLKEPALGALGEGFFPPENFLQHFVVAQIGRVAEA
ncbi:MAG: hypothetical protein ACKO96_27265, partial [Flammeovirgaceae bacterium]